MDFDVLEILCPCEGYLVYGAEEDDFLALWAMGAEGAVVGEGVWALEAAFRLDQKT